MYHGYKLLVIVGIVPLEVDNIIEIPYRLI